VSIELWEFSGLGCLGWGGILLWVWGACHFPKFVEPFTICKTSTFFAELVLVLSNMKGTAFLGRKFTLVSSLTISVLGIGATRSLGLVLISVSGEEKG